MKIFLAQQNYHIGHFQANTARILDALARAKAQGADLVVFSELCICGYPPRDFLEFSDFITQCRSAIDQICAHTGETGVIVGAPSVNPSPEGKRLFNSAWLLHQGEVKQIIHKTLLPTYDVFDEYRYFEPAYQWNTMDFKGMKLAVTICEDIWNLGDNPLYRICPMDKLMPLEPDLMINISASPFDYLQSSTRMEIATSNTRKYGLPLVYCNAIGAQTEIVFDGASLVLDGDGHILEQLPSFEEALVGVEIPWEKTGAGSEMGKKKFRPSAPVKNFQAAATVLNGPYDPEKNIPGIHDALILGIKDYFRKMGFEKAIVGTSGGIDSALTQALAVEALGAEQVKAVLMPSPFSSDYSVKDATQLSKNLGNSYELIGINAIFEAFQQTLKKSFGGLPFGVAEENMQSRIRGNILMSLSNKFGYILLNTSNKSELSTGYGTLYGDMAGGLSLLGDVYKTQVYSLAEYINRQQEIIPGNILEKAPSAELRPNQRDTDSLPDYALLDPVLYEYIEKRQGPREIIAAGFEPSLVNRILKLVNSSEYKRNQFCPIIRVSVKAFGVGRRVPIVGRYLD